MAPPEVKPLLLESQAQSFGTTKTPQKEGLSVKDLDRSSQRPGGRTGSIFKNKRPTSVVSKGNSDRSTTGAGFILATI